MAWKTRVFVAGRLGNVLTIEGDKPRTSIDIKDLITSLEEALRKGALKVQLEGIGTVYVEDSVLLSTESQI